MIEQEEKRVLANSANYFMLPMLQLNKSSFGVGNFINSYVDKAGYIVVDVKDNPVMSTSTILHTNYITDFNIEGGIRFVYEVPDEYLEDVKLFEAGKYSQFSPDLKVAISKYSGLPVTDIHIKCLNPMIGDREKLAEDLGVRVELVKQLKSAPSEVNFVKIK